MLRASAPPWPWVRLLFPESGPFNPTEAPMSPQAPTTILPGRFCSQAGPATRFDYRLLGGETNGENVIIGVYFFAPIRSVASPAAFSVHAPRRNQGGPIREKTGIGHPVAAGFSGHPLFPGLFHRKTALGISSRHRAQSSLWWSRRESNPRPDHGPVEGITAMKSFYQKLNRCQPR